MATKLKRKRIELLFTEISCFNSHKIQEVLIRAMEENNILIDMSQITYIDSSGMGMLVKLTKRANEKAVSLKFINLNSNIVEVITMLGLRKMFVSDSVPTR